MHPAKRRRTDNAASALAKPFRSPLTVAQNKDKPSSEKQDNLTILSTELTTLPNPYGVLQAASSPPRSVSSGTSPRRRLAHSSSSPIRPSAPHISDRDAVHVALQKQHSALLLQLKDLNASLDTASQALKIVQSCKDNDLEQLVTKWRITSRDCAEELFSTAKDKVNRMGGVGAWREKYMKLRESDSWGNEPEVDEDELSEEQKEQLEIARDEARLEAEKYGVPREQPLDNVKDDDSFTIDMMLRQLNVDLEVIGFDAQTQRWLD